MNKVRLIILSFTTIAAIIYSHYKKDLLEAQQRISSSRKTIDTNCGTIEYGIDGPESPAHTILVIHGSGGGFDQGLLIGKPFAEQGFRIIAPSRFGYLSSPIPKHDTVSEQAQVYKCLLDALHINKVDAIYGVSAGTPSSLKFTHDYPNRTSSLILSVPGLHITHPNTNKPLFQMPPGLLFMIPFFSFDFSFWMAMKLAPSLIMRTCFGTPKQVLNSANELDKDRLQSVLQTLLPTSSRLQGMNNEHKLMSEPVEYASEISTPTLIISHKDDLYGTYEIGTILSNKISSSKFVGYETGGHMGVGYAEEAQAEISSFIKNINQ